MPSLPVMASRGILLALLFVFVYITVSVRAATDDDLLSDVRFLYDSEETHYVDPNDMLADFQAIRKGSSDTKDNVKKAELVTSDCSSLQQALHDCAGRNELLEKQLKSESDVVIKLQKKLSEDGLVDYQPIYRRTLTMLRNALQLDQVEGVGEAGVHRTVNIAVSSNTFTDLRSCLLSDVMPPHQCDSAVSGLLQSVSVEPQRPTLLRRLLEADWRSLLPFINTLDASLTVVAGLLVLLLSWAALLLVRDVRTNRRWRSFIVMLCVVVFIFCCLWNWKNMIKEVESRRAAQWEMRGGDKCSNQGYWAWFTNSAGDCLKYYEESFISAAEEITPETVIVRTATTLALQPLRILGREMGHFFSEFYANVPFFYLIPASLMMLILLVVLMLVICGYSLEFPLFMGGIRPAATAAPRPAIDLDTVTQQFSCAQPCLDSIYQLRAEQQQFLMESRRMMLDISSATAQHAQIAQPILSASYRSIESQLDQLISSRLHSVLDRKSITATPTAGDIAPKSPWRRSSQKTIEDTPDGVSAVSCNRAEAAADNASCGSQGTRRRINKVAEDESGDSSGSKVEEEPSGDRSEFYQEICNVLDESLNASRQDGWPDGNRRTPGSTTPSRRKPNSEEETLSPKMKKYLSRIKDAFES